MSFLPIRQENDEAPTGQTTNAPGTDTEAPPETGGSVGEEATGAPAKGSATGTPTQFGSSASKLGDYLSANAPQIGQQADTLAGNLNTQYGTLNQGITDAANQFQSQVQGGYAAPNQALVGQAMADPSGFAADPNNVKAFQAQYNNAYTGPQNFEGSGGYADIQNQVGQAVQQGGLLGTQAGLQSYLQGQGKNPTQAMSTLDSLLLRGNPEGQAKINAAAGQFGNLTGQLGTAAAGANQSVQDAQKAAQDSAAYTKGQFDPFAQQFGSSLDTQLSGVNTNRDAYNTAVTGNQTTAQEYRARLLQAQQDAIQKFSGNLSNTAGNPIDAAAQQARVAGFINPQAQLGGLEQYLGAQPVTQPGTLANTSTAGQYGEDAALAKLLGQGYNPRLNQADIGQAGSYAIPGMPGAVQDPSGQIQYMGDVASLYGNPGLSNLNISGGWKNAAPGQLAQSLYNAKPGQGINTDAAQREALQRLIANQYAGRT